jgi:hypothetical protein
MFVTKDVPFYTVNTISLGQEYHSTLVIKEKSIVIAVVNISWITSHKTLSFYDVF